MPFCPPSVPRTADDGDPNGGRRSAQVLAVCLLACSIRMGVGPGQVRGANLEISPAAVVLDRPESSQQVLITLVDETGRHDVTRMAAIQMGDFKIAKVNSQGLVQPASDGSTTLVIRHGDREQTIPVTVKGISNPPPVSFTHEVLPVLTKARCNSGGCHGKAEGQGGFKLSLFGYDPPTDYQAIVAAGRGRRVMLSSPTKSLLLLKGTATIPHGGGLKLDEHGPAYQRIVRWLAAGAPREVADEQPVVAIEVEPQHARLSAGRTQQLRVTAIDALGSRRCVTVEADYVSGSPHIADVDVRGLLQASDVPGEAAILVRYQGHVAVSRVVLPRKDSVVARPPERNFIDRLVWDKLVQLGLQPSEIIDDATFLRRVYLDTIGTLPTAVEARTFLEDVSADKRSRLISQLLERPEYADYWAMKWSNLLRADRVKITPQATVGLTRWLRRQFSENRPYDAMVRDILTAQGPVQSESPAGFFKALEQPEVASRGISQLFLGVRIECAQCHHHPSERWGQDDYAGLVGFFTGISFKKLPDGTDAVLSKGGADSKHPRTGDIVPARALGAVPANFQGIRDRRQVLATWITQPENPFFAKAIVNRLWAHYLGRGLVEPIDDLRTTNPATNEPLFDALEAHLKEVRYDLKAFTRTLLESQVYQLSSVANASNADDRQNFSHAAAKALPAEVLLDAIAQVTGVPEKFDGWPTGVRAIQVWDNRMPSYFFRIFGRPVRATVCECERSNEPSISQALHLLNSPEINARITHRHGRARQLAESSLSPDQLIDEICLMCLSRHPSAEERGLLATAFVEAGTDRRQAVEDVLWTVLNSKEFLYCN